MIKKLSILGSTGSIGTQTLDVVRRNPERFEVYAISAHHNADLLVAQAREFRPEVVCIADESQYESLNAKLSSLNFKGKVWAGADAIAQMVTFPSDQGASTRQDLRRRVQRNPFLHVPDRGPGGLVVKKSVERQIVVLLRAFARENDFVAVRRHPVAVIAVFGPGRTEVIDDRGGHAPAAEHAQDKTE